MKVVQTTPYRDHRLSLSLLLSVLPVPVTLDVVRSTFINAVRTFDFGTGTDFRFVLLGPDGVVDPIVPVHVPGLGFSLATHSTLHRLLVSTRVPSAASQ